jgi:hypothetical protein
MKVTVKVDRRGILTMARELARYSPMPLEHIFRSEVGSIVKMCLLRSKVASKASVRRRVEARAVSNFEADNGARVSFNLHQGAGRVWFVPPDQTPTRGPAGNFLMILDAGASQGWHVRDEWYLAYLAALGDSASYAKALVQIMLTRRGLLRQSWLQILDQLRLAATAIAPSGNVQEAVVRSARGYRGRTYANGMAAISGGGSKLRLEVGNTSPIAIRRAGQSDLDRASAQRQRGFLMAVSKGMLTDQQARARRWPGIFVRRA